MRSALAALLLFAAREARADDPRDVFGLHKKPVAEPVDCGDGRELGCATATDPLADRSPAAVDSWLPARWLLGLPVGDASFDAVAHYATGAARDESGVLFGGATGVETTWSIDGASSANAQFGTNDTHLPLTFVKGIHATAAGFAARDRVGTGGMIDAELIEGTPDHRVDVRLWGSLTGTPRRRDIATGAYQLRRLSSDFGPDGTISLVATGPIKPIAGAWYATGIAPSVSTTELHWDTKSIRDDNHDGLADLVDPEDASKGFVLDPVESQSRAVTSWHVPAMARVGIDRGVHHVALTLAGEYDRGERDLALATVQAARVDRETAVVDAIATWKGTWRHTHARAQLAWHHAQTVETAHDPAAANLPQLLTAYVPGSLPEDPTLASACVDADPATFATCPIPAGFFASGGAGQLVDRYADRPTVTADVAHEIGRHVVRAGGVFEDVRLVTKSSYTGGEIDRSLFPGHLERAYFHGNGACGELFEQPCDLLAVSELNTRTRYSAAYVEDTFRPVEGVTVNAGVRWELMWVGTVVHFSDEFSPRASLSWDFLGGGRSRLFAGLGRSFAYLPAGLGAVVLPGDRRVRDITIAGIGATRATDTGAPVLIDPDLVPVRTDEATAGLELGWPRAVKLLGYVSGRRTRGMETASGGTILTNPSTDDPDEGASRQVVTAGLELATRGRLALRIGYLFTRAVGSDPGPASPREGATFYNSSDFDFSTANMTGRLPTDLGHRVFVEARRDGHLHGLPVAASVRLTANSGRPRDVLTFDGGETDYLLPRGSGGRGAMLLQSNVELFARLAGFDVTLDVFNLFDRRDPVTDDDYYSINGGASPIVGGSRSDLVFAKTPDGDPIRRSTNFQYGTSFQSPIAATLGIRRAF